MKKLIENRSIFPFVFGGCLSIGVSYLVFFIDRSTANEDGLIENLTAVFFLLASVCFTILYVRDSLGNRLSIVTTKRNIFYLLLAILFFVGAGEEISWGQRIFGIETPEALMQLNTQHEINLHNLAIFDGLDDSGNRLTFWKSLLSISRLFTIFWFGYCILIPIIHALSSFFRSLITEINLPVVPISVGLLFLVNYLVARLLLAAGFTEGGDIIEITEFNFASLFFLISLYFLRNMRYPIRTDNDSL